MESLITSSGNNSSSQILHSTNSSSILSEKKLSLDIRNVSKWSVESTIKWLKTIEYEDCGVYFREHRINGRALLMLGEDDLKEIIKHNVGQRKNLYHLIRMLQIKYNRYMNNLNSSSFFSNSDEDEDDDDEDESENDYDDDENDTDLNEDKHNDSNNNKVDEGTSFYLKNDAEKQKSKRMNKKKNFNYDNDVNKRANGSTNAKPNDMSFIQRHLINETDQEIKLNDSKLSTGLGLANKLKSKSSIRDLNENDDDNMLNFCENCLKKFDHSPYSNYAQNNNSNTPIRSYKGEKRKTLVSVVYLFLTCLWTSFMLTVVHDRVPDMQKYPPLPDIILDNVPLIPWAFFATELIGLSLLIMVLIILIFHKYRSIIFRRMCSLGGTIFFLRSITMLITSLSVPGIHIQCSSQRYGSLINKLHGAWNILSGVGLYVHGVRTCGDYMFSGHTVWLTLLTHFICEYTPNRMNWLHTFVWILNIFGLFFILGAHEHYSIDVFVAFYITSRLFVYYHSLANNKVLFQRDHKRVKIWFPLLSYFESNIHSMVPNEYQDLIYYSVKFFKNKWKQLKRILIQKVSSNTNGNSLKSKEN